MSKIYDEAVRKARLLAEGLNRNREKAEGFGINSTLMEKLTALANDAETKSGELDALREVVSAKSKEANLVLQELNRSIKEVKTKVKSQLEQPKWKDFGIEDKR